MLTVNAFYARTAWGLQFGARGTAYTIVPGRHIGLDIERTGDVPALLPGTVTAVILTSAMAWCVEVLTAGGIYLTYCHLANDNLPREGARLRQGARVGRLARGPKTLALRAPEFPGTAWTGQHLHLVASRIARAAWQLVKGRQLSDFIDPTTIITGVLTAPAGGNAEPFDPDAIEVEKPMPDKFIINHRGNLYLAGAGVANGFVYLRPDMLDVATAAFWALSDGKTLFDQVPTFDTKSNDVAFGILRDLYAENPAAITVDVDESAIAGQVIAALSPATLAQQIVAAGVAKAVADELAKRLAS